VELNNKRAEMRLAEVHAMLGFGQSALAYAFAAAYAEAKMSLAVIADEQDRAIVEETFNLVPAPVTGQD
jgi:hypothetical protein